MKFNKYILGDVVDIRSSKRVYFKDYIEKGIPFYRSKEIILRSKGMNIDNPLYISQEKFDELKNIYGVPKENDILLTSVGTIGIPYLVKKSDEFYFKDGNLTWFSNFSKDIAPRYLLYWFQSEIGKKAIDNIVIGSTQKALTMVQLKKINIELPSIDIQKKIINIINSLDSKIELNNQMIATLEELAATLFKRWFVDFEYPDENGNPYKSSGGKMVDSELGEIPEGWEVKSLEEVCLENKKNVSVDLLHLEDYISTENLLTDKKGIKVAAKKPSVKRVKQFIEGDVLISNIRPYFKKIWFSNRQGGYSSDVLNFRANEDKISSEYLFFYLYQDDFFDFMTITSKGTKMPRGDKAAIKGKKLIVPSNNVLSSYTFIVRAYVNKIGALRSENRALGGLRESLLPKLLSGEIILSK